MLCMNHVKAFSMKIKKIHRKFIEFLKMNAVDLIKDSLSHGNALESILRWSGNACCLQSTEISVKQHFNLQKIGIHKNP